MLDAVSTGLHPSAVITQLVGSMVLRSGLCGVIGGDGGSGSNMVVCVDKNMQKKLANSKTNMVLTSQKSPKMSKSMDKQTNSGQTLSSHLTALLKTSDLEGFQLENNNTISSIKAASRQNKDAKGPIYRRINKYTKSIKQYWKERDRRKQVLQLSSQGHTARARAIKRINRPHTYQIKLSIL